MEYFSDNDPLRVLNDRGFIEFFRRLKNPFRFVFGLAASVTSILSLIVLLILIGTGVIVDTKNKYKTTIFAVTSFFGFLAIVGFLALTITSIDLNEKEYSAQEHALNAAMIKKIDQEQKEEKERDEANQRERMRQWRLKYWGLDMNNPDHQAEIEKRQQEIDMEDENDSSKKGEKKYNDMHVNYKLARGGGRWVVDFSKK